MKKLFLSLCLLGVVAPNPAHAALSCPMPPCVKDLFSLPNAKKALAIAAIGWYYFIWKQRAPLDIDEDWSWSHVISRLGDEGYCQEVLTGNREMQRDVELTTIDQNTGLVITVTEKETLVPAYGIIGVLDSIIISKLKGFSKLIKYITRTRDFVKDPFALFTLEDKKAPQKSA